MAAASTTDYFAGQIKFLDTFSKLKAATSSTARSMSARDSRSDGATRVTIGPFVGFNYLQETAEGFGARCNDDVGGLFCGPPGSFAVPFSTQVITNEANWASLRLGAELKVRLWDRLTLVGDAAVLPVAYVWNDDSHLLRGDRGPVPNIQDRGTGWGYQLEGAVKLDITPCWAIGAGVRYWYAEVDGKSEFVNFDIKVPLEDFTRAPRCVWRGLLPLRHVLAGN